MKKEFNNPLNLLILLGFICQGFSWENSFVPFFYCAVWFLAIFMQRERQFLSQSIELLIFFLSLILSIKFIGHNSYSRLLAMGNALFVLQAMRLMWPLEKRKKRMAVMIAVTHIAVGSQFIVDYSFILVLIFSIILIPKSLFSIESEGFQGIAPRTFGKNKIIYPSITFIMIIFFLIFPRRKFISGKEAGMIITEGAMSAKMDTISGGANLSSRPILRIKGESIEYLKSFALDTFDGNQWSASTVSSRLEHTFSLKDINKCKHRQVRVMDLTYLGSALPVDGFVVNLKGNFFQGAIGISGQGNVGISLKWPQSINKYEYWTDLNRKEVLSPKERLRYTEYPDQSAKLKTWLDKLTASSGDQEEIADAIVSHFRKTFKYRVGVPDLKRSAPLDDFIFNRKEGHCERYASALALLLRMKNIPARVVVGYHVPPPNQFADFYNVQAKNGHAWVEAYIETRGMWTIFDGTPEAGSDMRVKSRGVAYTIKDWIEYVWYSKIVEFSPGDQKGLLAGTKDVLKNVLFFIRKEMKWVFPLMLSIAALVLIYHFRSLLAFFHLSGKREREKQLEVAERFYFELLKTLAGQGIYRKPAETPLELLESLRGSDISCIEEVELITHNFCKVKYAEIGLTADELKSVENALKRFAKSCVCKRGRSH
jgi:hypothetical protein